MLRLVLLVLAAVCFAILVFGGSLGHLLLLPLGLLLWVLADLCAGWGPAWPTRTPTGGP
jgi:hypothetical protein